MPIFKDKSGYEYIEAAFVMPLTALVVAAILAIMIFMFQELYEQTQEHVTLNDEAFEVCEMEKIRILDKLKYEIENIE